MTFAFFQHLHASHQDYYYYGIISQPCLVPRGPLPIIDVGSFLQIPSSSSPLSSHYLHSIQSQFSSSPTMDSIQDCNTELTIGLTGHNSRPLRFSDQLPFAPKPLYSTAGTLSHRNVAMDQGLVLFGQCISPLCSNDARELNQNNSNTVSPPNSTISSFQMESNGESSHLKPEEAEVEKAGSSSRFTDEEEEGGGTRKKLRLSQKQSAVLEESFKQNSTLNPSEKQALAGQLDLLPRQVEVWFQNRRARTKLKKTEQDCEKLRKCCISLTEQNRKLQKELEELRALKLAATAPFYMEMARSKSVSLCPSCQRVVKPCDLPKLQFYPSH